MDEKEVEIIKTLLKKSKLFLIKLGIFMFSTFSVIIFIPLNFLPSRRRSGLSNNSNFRIIDEPLGIYILIGLILLVLIIMYFIETHKLHKDLKYKIKVASHVKVKKIEYLSANMSRKTEGNKDVILHFQPNQHGILDFAFKKSKFPSFLKSKEFYIERAKYSKYEFFILPINDINRKKHNSLSEKRKNNIPQENNEEKLKRLKEKENPNRFMPK